MALQTEYNQLHGNWVYGLNLLQQRAVSKNEEKEDGTE